MSTDREFAPRGIDDVRIYRNTRAKVWSVKNPMGRQHVLGHVRAAIMVRCQFEVSTAGRDRVRRTGRKNVHAFIRGRMIGANELAQLGNGEPTRISYNPRVHDGFVDESGRRVFRALAVEFHEDGTVTAWGAK